MANRNYMWLRRFAVFILIIVLSSNVFATHNRAGEITYRWISDYTYEATITTYTYTGTTADRCDLMLYWGDGTYSAVSRINGPPGGGCTHFGEVLSNPEYKKNIYIGQHTYAAPYTYVMYFEDPNRNAGVNNIPNSVNVPFYVETMLVINPFIEPNNSPILLNPPIDNACVDHPFIHNPGAFDVDGDSLSYRLINCKGEGGFDIPGYYLPNNISINAITGDLLWDSPNQIGEYNVAILIEEWRMGMKIGSVTRDMQINVVICNNQPPQINDLSDVCIEAGSNLSFTVTATDPDNNPLTMTAFGGPLSITNSPAEFPIVSGPPPLSSQFTWQTNCLHIQKQKYYVSFKASDNGIPIHLFTIKTVGISVIPPSPKNLTAIAVGYSIHLNWDISNCAGPNAVGYKIYRHNGYTGFIPSNCETGVPNYTGYTQIADITNINTTSYIDDNGSAGLLHGVDYCYMVISYYTDGSESYASLEACAELKKDVPIITNISIKNTSKTDGSSYIAWAKPRELDTIQAPGPYKYLISRSFNGLNNYQLIDSVYGLNDTIYNNDTLINTKDSTLFYKIALYNETLGNRFLIGNTDKASSVFINIIPSDNELILTWNEVVPWTNLLYTIYRQNNATFAFDSVGFSTNNTYNDTALVNGSTYCYKIKSQGKYSAAGFVDPIINYSQINCGVPKDTTAPRCPVLTVIPDCAEIENTLIWTNPNYYCSNDVIKYEVWYSPTQTGELSLIYTANSANDTVFVHSNLNSIAGCYTVIAIDSVNNKSLSCTPSCLDIDNCPRYHLPNVFTPDNDGHNDLLIPFPYSFVEKIDLKIFNRWGELVFETQNPDVNWDGKNTYTKMNCSDGVYFYICDVYEIRLAGLKVRQIQGSVHILRK